MNLLFFTIEVERGAVGEGSATGRTRAVSSRSASRRRWVGLAVIAVLSVVAAGGGGWLFAGGDPSRVELPDWLPLITPSLSARNDSQARLEVTSRPDRAVVAELGHAPGLQARVELPIPHVDFNPTKWVQDAFSALLQSLSDGIRVGMDALWAANFIAQTPPSLTYQNDDIRGLYGTMQSVANAALALITTVGALNGLLRPHFGLRYHSLSAFVPRLLVGAILVNTSVWWVQFAIDVNNALAASIGNATPPNWNALNGAHQALTDVVLGLVYVIVGLLLLLQMLMRLAWIDVLLVVSPLAAACWVLPQTQGWAQSWNEQFTGAVFTQFVQVVALKLGGMLLAAILRMEPDVNWLSFLLGAATLWLTWRIPGLMRAGAGGNIADALAKALMLRFVVRGGGK